MIEAPRLLRRLRSLRVRAVLVVLVVAVLPLVLVVVVNRNEEGAEERMAKNTANAVDAAAAFVAVVGLDVQEQIAAIAFRHRVRLRVVPLGTDAVASGQQIDVDKESGSGAAFAAGNVFFGPDGAPTLTALEQTWPAVPARAESITAATKGIGQRCQLEAERRLLVCSAAVVVDVDGQRVLVHSIESSRRAVRALYDLRYQLLKLSLLSLPAALILAFWLGWRMVRPLEMLRKQVQARARELVPSPVDVDRADEFGDLALAFNELLARLQDRRRQSAELIADLAHEFKNPVAAVRAAAEQLEGFGAPEGPGVPVSRVDAERVARLAGLIGESSKRLDALVTEFLALARAEAGLEGDLREDVDVKALVQVLIERSRGDVRTGAVSLELSGDAAVVSAVPVQLERALGNLIDNAVSFAGADGRAGRVLVRLARTDQGLCIDVVDDGPGISALDLPRVFERYFTTRAMKHGTGLGLALARAIVQAHGGTLTATSTAGAGATFSVLLP
ncbi:MAG: HAMP domain-containing sensor histidine kinase [Deltaproteobacteria bacterium]|nr:HAMP domain-containing sensor histidine kinase [Deltaproteobacteria bacterium]